MQEKELQKLLDAWCEDWEIPKIKVVVSSDLERGKGAMFYEASYEIYINKRSAEHKELLKHEFRHYLISLIKKSDEIEERICDKE